MVSAKSIIFVLIQFTAIGILAFTGNVIPGNIFLKVILFLSLSFGVWAIIIIGYEFNIFPELMPGSRLITSGPYKYVRHPMYTAVLAITLIWLIDEFTIFRFAVWIVLLVDLVLKFKYEEKILLERFDGYENYQKSIKALVPFIY